MDPFANVFGAQRGGAVGAADALNAGHPSELARRKLTDACRGLGGGVPDYALKALQSHSTDLDKPLLAELSERLVTSLTERALRERADAWRLALHTLGVRPGNAERLVAQRGDADVPSVHIFPEGAAYTVVGLAGARTACGIELTAQAFRVNRGEFAAARQYYNRPFYGLHPCGNCVDAAATEPDALEGHEYPLLEPADLISLTTRCLALVRERLLADLETLTPALALTLAGSAFDEAVVTTTAEVAVRRGEMALRYALRGLYPATDELVRGHGIAAGAAAAAAAPSAEQWKDLLAGLPDAVQASQHNSTSRETDSSYLRVLHSLRDIIAANAAQHSGQRPYPSSFEHGVPEDAFTGADTVDGVPPSVSAAPTADDDDAAARARVLSGLKRV